MKRASQLDERLHDLVMDHAQWVTKDVCHVIVSGNASDNNVPSLADACHCVVKEVSRDINLAGIEKLQTLICSLHYSHLKDTKKLLKSIRVLILRCNELLASKHLGKLVQV